VDAVFDAGQVHWMVLANEQLFQQHHCEELLARVRAATEGHQLDVPPNLGDALTNWMSSILASFPIGLDTQHSPSLLHSLEQGFVERLSCLLMSDSPTHRRPAPGARSRGLNQAIDKLRSAPTEKITISDLCQCAGVSRRTLEYAFQEQLGMSPVRYLRLRRLHAVRHELMLAQNNDRTVTEVAIKNGFVDLGRFAQSYFTRFGEHPSQTLRRLPASRPAPQKHLRWSN
jgi:transcriptional regulator GlxA family with amidase domain